MKRSSLPRSIQALPATDGGATHHTTGRPPCWVRAVANNATALRGRLDPTVVAAGVRLQLRPNAAELAFHHAAWITTTGGIASETDAIEEQAPACRAEHIELFLLTCRQLFTPTWVQVATTHQRAATTARRVAWRDFTVEQRATTLDRRGDTAITVKAMR